jgi:hypothetical protein
MKKPFRIVGYAVTSLVVLIVPASGVICAQTDANPAPAPPSSGSPNPPSASSTNTANRSLPATSSQQPNGAPEGRLFYALPNFLTVENEANVPPLTTGEKFKLTARDSFDPVEFVWYGALAGIAQWQDSERVFGQGAMGYAKRYGVRFGDGTIENFVTHPIFGSIFHQDPRYFRLGKGGVLRRGWYAFNRIFVTRSDSGTTQFNISEVLGAGVAAGISTYTYHPGPDRNWSDVLEVWGSQMGQDALGYIAKEFWPDIRRKLGKSKKTNPAGVAQISDAK